MKKHVHMPAGMRARRWLGVAAASLVLGGCLTAGVAFADEATDDNPYGLEEVPSYLQAGLFSDQEASDGLSIMSVDDENEGFPEALDLRHYNGKATYDAESGKTVITGGINYVTPVKLQNPFGSCWAFSIIAASETSLLTSLDKADDGLMNGTVDYESAASGDLGSEAYSASDLSERALAYSLFTYPKSTGIYSTQAGEGTYMMSGIMGDGASILNAGGMPFSGISTFSCGIGPVAESYAPYISDEGWVEVYIPKVVMTSLGGVTLDTKAFTSLVAAQDYVNTVWSDEIIAQINEKYGFSITWEKLKPSRSSKGTWSVDGDKTYGTVAELTESKILEVENGDGLTDDEIALMKQELMEGRAISIAFCADQSQPGQSISANSSYMNTDNWAQYTYESQNVNHGVTIVGYDDNYAKENFSHPQYSWNTETQEYEPDADKTALTTPEGDGAWIVKNSWGSSTADNLLDQESWGNEGYFYLSYYDKNIANMESFEFDTSAEAQERESFLTDQYDLSKGSQTESKGSADPLKTCNVFDGPEEGDNPIEIRDLGCITGAVNDTVTFDIYVMDADDDPATYMNEHEPVLTATEFFETSGFHRIHLDETLIVDPGLKIAIVQTTKRVNGKYEATVIRGIGQDFAQAYNDAHTSVTGVNLGSISKYTYTVVNRGESLVCLDGEWCDWVDYMDEYGEDAAQELIADVQGEAAAWKAMAALYEEGTEDYEVLMEIAYYCENFDDDCGYAYDNFSIKYYADEVEVSHEWGDPEITFSEDGKTATATWTCANDEAETITLDCIVTSEVTKEATCAANGETTYTAIASGTDKKGAQLPTGTSFVIKDDIPGPDHVYTGSVLIVGPAGYYTYYVDFCRNCGTPKRDLMDEGWVKNNGNWYYVDEDHCTAGGWLTLNGKSYYLDPDSGVMATAGWNKIDGTWYYMKASGAVATGWGKIDGNWYYFKADGSMVTGWQKINGSWYYFKTSGKMATGWGKINGNWYYLGTNGKMVANTTMTINGKKYTFAKNGCML